MKPLFVLLIVSAISLTSCLDKLAESPGTSEADDTPAYEREAKEVKENGSRTVDKAPPKKKVTLTELRSQKKALLERVKELEDLASSEASLIAEEVAVTEELEGLRAYEGKLEKLGSELNASLNAWKNATRTSFVGVQLPEIATVDGRTYTAVVIQEVEDDSVTIQHSGGSETIEILQLPVGLRKNLIHEPTVLATRGQ